MAKTPIRKPEIDLSKLDAFAGNLEKEVLDDKPTIIKPWEHPRVRNDIVRGIGVPLTEPHLLKLQFISKHTKFSMRKFCQKRLQYAIDREVKAILKALEAGQEYWSEPD